MWEHNEEFIVAGTPELPTKNSMGSMTAIRRSSVDIYITDVNPTDVSTRASTKQSVHESVVTYSTLFDRSCIADTFHLSSNFQNVSSDVKK